MSEIDPLVERVDALLKRHQQPRPAPDRPPGSPPESPLPLVDGPPMVREKPLVDETPLVDGKRLLDEAPFADKASLDDATVIGPPLTGETEDDDIPVLTEVVESTAIASQPADTLPAEGSVIPVVVPAPFTPAPPPAFDEKALVAEIESAVIDKLRAQLARSLPSQLNRVIGDLLDQAVDGLRADLSATVRQTVREAVEKALGDQSDERSSDSTPPPEET